jgi:hypothetical protein
MDIDRIRNNIDKYYGGLIKFCEQKHIPYMRAYRALQAPYKSDYYKGIAQNIDDLINEDLPRLEKADVKRGHIKSKIRKNYKSVLNFSRISGMNYITLWKYCNGLKFELESSDVDKLKLYGI